MSSNADISSFSSLSLAMMIISGKLFLISSHRLTWSLLLIMIPDALDALRIVTSSFFVASALMGITTAPDLTMLHHASIN